VFLLNFLNIAEPIGGIIGRVWNQSGE